MHMNLLVLCVAMQHFVIQAASKEGIQANLDEYMMPGIPGLPGLHGPPGIDGNTGINGFTGHQGFPGKVGPRGPQGPDGIMGTMGQIGRPGLYGLAGVMGAEGYRGVPGNHGSKGLSGPKGKSGKTGSKGLKGDPGSGQVPQDDIVAFTVARATEMSASKPISIDFTHILSDINGDFDMVNDSFTCRIPGVYLFSFSFASDSATSPSVNMVRNSSNLLGSYSTSVFSVVQTSTNMMVLNLVKGDTIYLELSTGSSIHCRGKMLCSFTGVLFHAT
ncbi:collagen alpha-1(X) chain-like isoform X2 [Anneissia japonica]|uniref:collagen alpha-1(X) chain-like isoform X2 n=1 Tax=Anneissia japonica TaxID=1529436 RepID=UPI0014255449|nr:collagen alpha-1(X) chain-like isoform X2 [Anneissia japonica]